VDGGVDAEHDGSWRPTTRALGAGREASQVYTLTFHSDPAIPEQRSRVVVQERINRRYGIIVVWNAVGLLDGVAGSTIC
jgi:hypothetical protein